MVGFGQSVSAPILPGLRRDNGPDRQWAAAEAGTHTAKWRPGSVQRTTSAKSSSRPASRFSPLPVQETSLPTGFLNNPASWRPASVQRATSAMSMIRPNSRQVYSPGHTSLDAFSTRLGGQTWPPGSAQRQRATTATGANRPTGRFWSASKQEDSLPAGLVKSSASQLRPQSGLANSASQLRPQSGYANLSDSGKVGSPKLPALPPNPLSFEDFYSLAKRRAVLKSAEIRKSKKLPSAVPEDSARKDCSSIREAEDQWASSALEVMKDVEKSPEDSASSPEGTPRVDEPAPQRPTSKPTFKSVAKAIKFAADVCGESKKSEERKSYFPGRRPTVVSNRKSTIKSCRASVNYIAAMRKAIKGESANAFGFVFDGAESFGVQDFSTALTRHAADSEGFTDEELNRVRITFNRFKNQDNPEIHVDDLQEALHYLGYMKSDNEQAVKDLVAQISRFSTLDYEEFVEFCEKFATWEQEQFEAVFDELDESGSGTLDMTELKTALMRMGITPLKATLEESRRVVDIDGEGEFDFDEFLNLMAVYRVTEGFTRDEVLTIRAVFDRIAVVPFNGTDAEIRTNKLEEALIHWVGPQSADFAKALAKKLQLISGESCDADRQGSGDDYEEPGSGLPFPEFLVWARRLREAEICEYRVQFDRYNSNKTGQLAQHDIAKVIGALGYIPLQTMVEEALDSCDTDDDGFIDFDEFVNLMAVYRATDGFSKEEMDEFQDVFKTYKQPGHNEVSCIELMDILRGLGYVTTLTEVRKYVKEVDIDNSNNLDFREFLRLMRLRREAELKEVKRIFLLHSRGKPYVKTESLVRALEVLGYMPKDDALEEILEGMDNPEDLNFDGFVSLVDHSRKESMVIRRKNAGFTDEELKKYEVAFKVYDEDGNGDIEKDELTKLLRDLGIPMRTFDDQKSMLSTLDEARVLALRAGVEPELVGNQGDPAVTFHTLLHLVRHMKGADDRAEVDRDTQAMQKLNFTPKEIGEFRDIFNYYAVKPQLATKTDKGLIHKREGAISKADKEIVLFLSQDGVIRVVRSLGLRLTPAQKGELENKVQENSDNKKRVGFTEFLVIMRWMLDSDFGGLNEIVAAAGGIAEQ